MLPSQSVCIHFSYLPGLASSFLLPVSLAHFCRRHHLDDSSLLSWLAHVLFFAISTSSGSRLSTSGLLGSDLLEPTSTVSHDVGPRAIGSHFIAHQGRTLRCYWRRVLCPGSNLCKHIMMPQLQPVAVGTVPEGLRRLAPVPSAPCTEEVRWSVASYRAAPPSSSR
jgi:hypothetical protein